MSNKTRGLEQYHLTDEQRQKIKDLYLAGYTTTQIAKELGIHKSTVSRNTLKMGLRQPNKEAGKRLTPEQIEEIKRLYTETKIPVTHIAKRIGVTRETIFHHLNKAGLIGKRDIPQETIDKAIQLYIDGKLTIDEITAETGLSRATLYRKLRKYFEERA